MLTARQIMTPTVFTLPRDSTLVEAIDKLAARGVSGAPVSDGHGRLLGVISKGDIAEALLANGAAASTCVEEVMSGDTLTAEPDESLASVAKRMVFEGVHRAVIIDEERFILGIITLHDVLRAVVDGGSLENATARTSHVSFPSWPAASDGR